MPPFIGLYTPSYRTRTPTLCKTMAGPLAVCIEYAPTKPSETK